MHNSLQITKEIILSKNHSSSMTVVKGPINQFTLNGTYSSHVTHRPSIHATRS